VGSPSSKVTTSRRASGVVGTTEPESAQHPWESVLDLTFTTSSMARCVSDWQIIKEIGSDHFGILFSVLGTKTELVDNPLQLASFNTKLANWDLFASSLKANILKSKVLIDLEPNSSNGEEQIDILEDRNISLTSRLDVAAIELTEAITGAAKTSIPTSKPGAKPKPWWSPELLQLRKDMLKKQRETTRLGPVQPYLEARNAYFQAIKKAKRDHWNQFLEKEDSKSIFKAMAYTKDGKVERIPPIQANGSRELRSSHLLCRPLNLFGINIDLSDSRRLLQAIL
jgi:hypothetical protein